jgi:hypothetical protein
LKNETLTEYREICFYNGNLLSDLTIDPRENEIGRFTIELNHR